MIVRPSCSVRRASQRGQSFMIILIFVSLLLLAVLGVALDYSQIWAHRQMAQAAADAACQAGAADLYLDAVDSGDPPSGGFSWIGTAFDCSTKGSTPPCQYASINGYSGSAVSVSFPSSLPGVSGLPSGFTVAHPYILVTVTDPVALSFTKLVSSSNSFTISAKAGCGVGSVNLPIPLVILNREQTGTLSTNGGTGIKIIGGPQRAIQVDSTTTTAVSISGSGTINLAQAGPAGTGADFGVSGSESQPGGVSVGTGSWISPDVPFGDPWQSTSAPGKPSAGTSIAVPLGINGCPDPVGCVEFTAGDYTGCSTSKTQTPGAATPGCIVLPYQGSNPGFSSAAPNWSKSTAYTAGAIILPVHAGGTGNCSTTANSGGYVYIATTSGTTASSCPALFNQTVCTRGSTGTTCTNGTTTDGGVIWQNIGQINVNKLATAIFDPGLYYMGANGVQINQGATARISTATGAGTQGVMFYFSTSATVSMAANSGNSSPCTSASYATATGSPNGCVVSYSVLGNVSSLATGYVQSRTLYCSAAGSSSLPSLVTSNSSAGDAAGYYDGNIVFGPCSGTYGSSDSKTRGFLFFQNRATAAAPSLSGGAGFIFSGFMYFHYATSYGSSCGSSTSCLSLSGNTSNASFALGDVTVDELSLSGGATINMILNPSITASVLRPTLLE